MKNNFYAAVFLFPLYLLSSFVFAQSGTFTDPRDGEQYRTVEINGVTWMAENLRFETEESKGLRVKKNKYYTYYKGSFKGAVECGTTNDYGTKAITCAHLKVVGRYYEWEDASKACPDGWHLSTSDEWEALFTYVSDKFGPFSKSNNSGNNTEYFRKVAPYLKSVDWTTGTEQNDPLKFSIMPDGYGKYDHISLLGNSAEFWTSTPLIYKSGKQANGYYKMIKASLFSSDISREDGIASNKRSVRCVKD